MHRQPCGPRSFGHKGRLAGVSVLGRHQREISGETVTERLRPRLSVLFPKPALLRRQPREGPVGLKVADQGVSALQSGPANRLNIVGHGAILVLHVDWSPAELRIASSNEPGGTSSPCALAIRWTKRIRLFTPVSSVPNAISKVVDGTFQRSRPSLKRTHPLGQTAFERDQPPIHTGHVVLQAVQSPRDELQGYRLAHRRYTLPHHAVLSRVQRLRSRRAASARRVVACRIVRRRSSAAPDDFLALGICPSPTRPATPP